MNWNRKINRIKFHFVKFVLKFISLFNHRLYMKYYVPLLRAQGMTINGKIKYIGPNTSFDDFEKIVMGNNVVVSDLCRFMTHDYSYTTALISIKEEPKRDIALIRGIEIGDNVFIGARTIIMPGTKIGNDVIIGAGSVVRGRVENDSIIIGNPGTKVRSTSEQARKWKEIYDKDNLRYD